jgi:DNA-binding transcriptional LysR family regulator
MVERGELDVAFALPPFKEMPLETIELLRDPYVLVVGKGSPLAKLRTTPSLADILDEPLIGFRTCRSMEPFESAVRATGREATFTFRTDDNGTVQGMVAAGIGIAVLPRLSVDATDPRVVVLELGNRVPPRLIAIVRHRDRYHSPAARAFVETALAIVSDEQLAA